MADSDSRRRVATPAVEEEPTFSPAQVMEQAEAFGHPRYVVAGALHGVADDAELTKAAVAKRVAQWLGMTVE